MPKKTKSEGLSFAELDKIVRELLAGIKLDALEDHPCVTCAHYRQTEYVIDGDLDTYYLCRFAARGIPRPLVQLGCIHHCPIPGGEEAQDGKSDE